MTKWNADGTDTLWGTSKTDNHGLKAGFPFKEGQVCRSRPSRF